ncbi:sensor histidine kinase [Actinosynnema sp. CS-041913]|uniref:sensor histidine kinase n=1 Tax=Actinosynnema sp. CS-041913 TaxID=3239917 RepID=UPI003D8E6EF1
MRRDRWVDAAVVVLAALLGTAEIGTQVPDYPAPYDTSAFGLPLVAAAALWFRRAQPVAVAWFVTAVGAILVLGAWVWPGVGTELAPDRALLPGAAPFAAYAVAAFAGDSRSCRSPRFASMPRPFEVDRRTRRCGVPGFDVNSRTRRCGIPGFDVNLRSRGVGFLAFVVLAVLAYVSAPPGAQPTSVVGVIVTLLGAPAALGAHVAARAERARQALRAERLRLAAEIHDVVGHRVTVMVLQAGALRLTAADEHTRGTAEDLRATGCQVLDELRDLVGLLNAGTPDPADVDRPEPLPDLAELVETSRSVGVAVEVAESGEPRALSPAVSRTAYRVVQEALTNVRKHAPGARVRLVVRHLPAGLRVTVHSTRPAAVPDPRLPSGGTGLLGLRRRIDLLGGELRAGPTADGGFHVDATLPTTVGAGP